MQKQQVGGRVWPLGMNCVAEDGMEWVAEDVAEDMDGGERHGRPADRSARKAWKQQVGALALRALVGHWLKSRTE